jgi:hypothetical protein
MQVKSGSNVVEPLVGALGVPPSVDLRPRADGLTDASQGAHDDVHRLHACAQASLPHSGSSGQLWDGSAACGCPRQKDEIRQGKRARTCIRCGCGCGRCAHATVVQQLECTLEMPQHSRPVKSRARISVGVGQLVRGGKHARATARKRRTSSWPPWLAFVPSSEDRPKEAVTQSANHWRNDAAAALDLLDAADWSDFLADAEFFDRSNKPAVQQLADKIRAAGHVRGRAVVR